MTWMHIDTAPEGIEVMTKIEDCHGTRNEQPMLRRGSLWFIYAGTEKEMYVYYTPTHWRTI